MRIALKTKGPKRLFKAGIVLFTALVLVLCAPPEKAQADGGCDPQYMQSLKGRSNSEAKRLSAQNRNYVYKPDSVLEYSCFFSFVVHAQNNISMPISPGPWDNIVSTPGFEFMAHNFGHSYLNGHFDPGDAEAPEGDYLCDAMGRLWTFARCIQHHQYAPAENSIDFSWYVNNDPRQFPADFPACAPAVKPIDLKDAFNGREAEWDLYRGFGDDIPYPTDPVQTYLTRTDWTVSAECGPPIPTGLHIYRKTSDYMEYVCAKPGCTYVPGPAAAAGTCVK